MQSSILTAPPPPNRSHVAAPDQSSIATTPPPPKRSHLAAPPSSTNSRITEPAPADTTKPASESVDDVDIHWTFDDDDWCEVGDQTRLRVSEGLPVEIETFSLDLDAAVTAAEQAYDHPICLVGDWVRHASGRSTVFVAVIA